MQTHRRARIALLCAPVVLLAGCTVQIPFLNAGNVEKARKAYAVQQKLKALAFTIQTDGAGGQLAFIASKEVKSVPLSINIDLAQSPMTRAVSVAGIAVPLQGGGPVRFDAPLRAALAGKGVPPPTITEIETQLNLAIDTVNTLGA